MPARICNGGTSRGHPHRHRRTWWSSDWRYRERYKRRRRRRFNCRREIGADHGVHERVDSVARVRSNMIAIWSRLHASRFPVEGFFGATMAAVPVVFRLSNHGGLRARHLRAWGFGAWSLAPAAALRLELAAPRRRALGTSRFSPSSAGGGTKSAGHHPSMASLLTADCIHPRGTGGGTSLVVSRWFT